MARRCWKHSRQKTGRPCVGRKGTVVSLPHWEQLVFVSARIGEALLPPPPPPSARLALQALQRLGSFLKPLSAKNICSPAVKTNSAPHSAHFRTLSWYSIEPLSLDPGKGRGMGALCTMGLGTWGLLVSEGIETDPLGLRARSCNRNPNVLALKGPDSRKCGAEPRRGGRLVRFAPLLLAQSLPRKRFFCPALLAGFHVEAVLLYFLDDVFLLHLALKAAQGIFQRFTLLDDDFCHCINSPPIRFGLDNCAVFSRYFTPP
jgi:hypothetical protein